MTDDRTLHLFSAGLLSKWGFSDGDEPDDVADWLEADGIEYGDIPWRTVLRRLVRDRLVPALDQQVVVYDIETSHNPIRAETVDGIEVDDYGDNPGIVLTPESVSIPYVDVLTAVRDEMRKADVMTDELVTFLRARRDEDERDAHDVHAEGCTLHSWLRLDMPSVCDCGWPARVLRKVAADRLLIDECADLLRPDAGITDPDEIDPGSWLTLRFLALPDADHPDYRPEWAPAE